MSRQRVLHVLASDARRGAEVFAVHLARALQPHGWESSVVAIARSASPVALDVPTLGDRLTPATVWKLRRLMGDHDVAIAHGSTALPACALAAGRSRPFVYRSIGDPAYWSANGIKRYRTDLLLRRARFIVALWDGAAESFSKRGFDPMRVIVIPNGVNADSFSPVTAEERSTARRELGIAADARLVLYLGALSAEKRPHLAVSLASAQPGLTVCIVGDGPLLSEMRIAASQTDNLRIDGPTDRPAAYLAAADVLFLPSVTEGLPAAAIEAQLRGVPVVASDVGGLRSIVDDGTTGLLAPSDDEQGLVDAALRTLTPSPADLEAHRKRLLDLFGMDAVSGLWDDVLRGSPSQPRQD